jgi:hypothetical protein
MKHNFMICQECKNHIIAKKIKLWCVMYRVNIKRESTVHQDITWMFIHFHWFCKAESGIFDNRFLRMWSRIIKVLSERNSEFLGPLVLEFAGNRFLIFLEIHIFSRVRNCMSKTIYNLLLNNETGSICFLVFRYLWMGGTCDCLGGVLQIGMFL